MDARRGRCNASRLDAVARMRIAFRAGEIDRTRWMIEGWS
jgi:hypothetical protein